MKVQNNAKPSSILGGEVTRYLLKKCKEETEYTEVLFGSIEGI